MDSGDDRSSTAGVGPDWALIPGSASALFDTKMMEGMERLVRHDGESRDTDRLTWSRHRRIFGGQGVRREAGSERLEENHRVVIDGSNPDR